MEQDRRSVRSKGHHRSGARPRRLLLDIPDLLFFEGGTAYLLDPQPDDDALYTYGLDHAVFEGNYLAGALLVNRVRVEGRDASGPIIADSFAWEEVGRSPQRGLSVLDSAMTTRLEAADLGAARLRRGELAVPAGSIVVPVNCGQQLFDVIVVTDARAGLDGVTRRVTGIALTYDARRGRYWQRLELGAV